MTKGLLLVALALVLAGCASNNGATSTSTTTSTTTPPMPTVSGTPGNASGTPVTTTLTTTTTTTPPTPTSTTQPTPTTPTPPTPPAAAAIAISGFAFQPPTLEIARGTNVTWTNADGTTHTATSDAGAPVAFDTKEIAPDASGSFEFTTPGTYHYHCAIHTYMKGTITVT